VAHGHGQRHLSGGYVSEPNRRWSGMHPEVIERPRQHPLGSGRPDDPGPLTVCLTRNASRGMICAILVIDNGYAM